MPADSLLFLGVDAAEADKKIAFIAQVNERFSPALINGSALMSAFRAERDALDSKNFSRFEKFELTLCSSSNTSDCLAV